MKSNNKIKLSIMPHPFKVDRVDTTVEKATFLELFNTYVETDLGIEHAVIFDNDLKIQSDDYESVPTSNHVIIKMVPAGDTAQQQTANAEKIGGGILAVLGLIINVVAGWTGIGGFIGTALMGTGISLLFSGVALYNMDIPDLADREQGDQLPSIRGSRNQTRIDGMIPILLGKHLITPDNAALPYTTVSGAGDQYLHQLFCLGYNDIVVDESTLKIGDTPYTEFIDASAEIIYNEASNLYYPARVVEAQLSIEMLLPSWSDIKYNTRVTTTNTKKVTVTLSFPTGLVKYNTEGDAEAYTVSVRGVIYHYEGYSATPVGSFATTSITRSSPDSMRYEFSYTFDNDTPASPDYNDKRQYRIQFFKNTIDATDTKIIDKTYYDNLKCYTGVFDNINPPNTTTIIDSIKSQICTMSVSIKADNQLKGVIDQLNCIAQLHTKTYSGTGTGPAEWLTVAASSNPAAMFRYVLQDTKINPHPLTDDQIDWLSLEAWYIFCAGKGFECNAVLNANITMEVMLTSITSTGRAAWVLVDGKYTIVIDTVKSNIVQMFTPRNSWDFQGSKLFPDNPDALQMQFIDASTGYTSAERIVYYDEDNPPLDPATQSVSLFGVTNATQAWSIGRYMLAVNRLRPESYTFNVDVENIVCTKGDRILFTHDAALIGKYQGRVKAIYVALGDTEGFQSDELINYEVGKSYGIRLRLIDGTIITKSVVNQLAYTDDVIFETPVIGLDTINASDLFSFGELGEETVDLLVGAINPNDDLSASLTCILYSPEVFNADTGVIPDYEPMISSPGDGVIGSYISTFDPTSTVLNLQAQAAIDAGYLERAGKSLVASRPDAFDLLVSATELCVADSNEVVYVDLVTSFLSKKRITDTFGPEVIGTVIASNPASAGFDGSGNARVLYVNKEDSDRIYIKSINSTTTGTAVTTSSAERPRYIGDDEFLYIGLDGLLYRGLITDAFDGTAVTTFGIGNYDSISATNIVYTNWAANSTIYVKTNSGDDVGVQIAEVTAGRLTYSAGYVYYLNFDDEMNVYVKDITTPSTEIGIPTYTSSLDVGSDSDGNVVYISLYNNNEIYSGLSDPAITGGFLEASPNQFVVIGDLTSGSAKITNMTADAISQVVVGDNFYHAYLPLNTKVIFRGNNYVTVNNTATGTLVSQSIQVAGTRIVLDANRVIIDGTVTANLLEASAINSKAKTVGGYFKSEYDLDLGTQKLRKDDDTIVLDFDPDRTGSELLFRGDVDITSDDANRHVQVGSKGLLVQDVLGTPIHDIPDREIGNDYNYIGHLISYGYSTTSPYLFSKEVSTVTSATKVNLGSGNSTYTFTSALLGLNTNVNAVLLMARSSCYLAADKGDSAKATIDILIQFYTDSTYSKIASRIKHGGVFPSSPSVSAFSYYIGPTNSTQVIVPIVGDTLYYTMTVNFNDVGSGNARVEAQASFDFMGMYI